VIIFFKENQNLQNMTTFEWSFKNPAGVEIYAKGWLPDDSGKRAPKAIVLLQHGLGEHIGRYEHVAEWFCSQHIAVLGCDRSGHGKSGGKRGHIAKYEYTLLEIEALHTEATRRFPSVPVFLYGHSMGGGIVLNYLLRKKHSSIKGIIATSPAVRPGFKPSGFDVFMGKIMRKIYGGYSQSNKLDATKVSSDPQVVAKYQADPLVHDRITAETGIGLLQWGEYALENVGELKMPVLILHGTADALTDYSASKAFAEKAKGDITFSSYEGGYHELHNEPNKQKMLKEMSDWIIARLK